ncbi:unnamed protein product [Euphydryas editha]|uniref:Reverse transcriptase domain-containing protein n=1 Tax=Euphydryas editha TaxID=104508 RepID=A0AAU9TIU9_EUPED|nr:unnamed protein product [Euphydryas editha]
MVPKNESFSICEGLKIGEGVGKLLTMGAIVHCEPCEGQYLSKIFTVPKPNGGNRFILNLKQLNKFISTEHFKLEDTRTVTKLMTPGCYMSTIDLKDAYFLLPIHYSHRKYLRFYWKERIFEFSVFPFGLSTGPYVFTKLLKPVIQHLRSRGFVSVIYLDDIWCYGRSFSECHSNVQETIKLLTHLGFIINYEKSSIVPNTTIKFLGFLFDSKKFIITLPQEKRLSIENTLKKFISLKYCKIRELAQVTGLLVSACPAIDYGFLHTKELERQKYLYLNKFQNNYEKTMPLSDKLKPDFMWWLSHIGTSVSIIKRGNYAIEIFSDSSLTGWGCSCGKETAAGLWNELDRLQHINYLELNAAFRALKTFTSNVQNCEILLRIDNTTAISYINRMGGIQYPHLNSVTRNIWEYCESKNLFVFASYIKSSQNVIADAESRKLHSDIECELSDKYFYKIVFNFGDPQIDLFASHANKKCDLYQASILPTPYPGCRALVREAFSRRGVSEATKNIMLASLSENTMKQYNTYLKYWFDYCLNLNINYLEASVPHVLCFLTKLYEKGAVYSSINCCKSALALILGPKISNDDRIARFLKGIFRLRPPHPKYDITWDVSIVLNFLSNKGKNSLLTLEDISKKLITLLAIVTAHRVQTFSLIKLSYIQTLSDKIYIKIPDHIKTSKVGSVQPSLVLPFFNNNPNVCPATTLLNYIDKTSNIRKCEKLFIAYKKPHNYVSSQTLSRWIKNTLENSGIDISIFSAHSTRHAATSAAKRMGVNIETIRRTAGWSSTSRVFAQFYNREIIAANDFSVILNQH